MGSSRIGLLTRARLCLAGWRPHRDVSGQLTWPESLVVFPEAERVLRRFGGLRFGDPNEYVRIDPVAATEDDEGLTGQCELAVSRRLYPIGYQEHQDRETIFVDETGRVYIHSGERLYLLAETFEAALAGLVRPPCFPQRGREDRTTSWLVSDDSRLL